VSSKADDNTTIEELLTLVEQFRDARNWGRFHTPPALASAIAIEAAELLELFQWGESWKPAPDENAIADELADVLIYALSMAGTCGIDVYGAVRQKMAKNAVRYPVMLDGE